MSDNSKKISLSVIVPCYNVEPYLDRSLACLSRQWGERTDYEIILVNDASTDNTINKLNEFKSQFPDNVIVIDKKVNAGAAEARNSGLDVAKGDWIVFFDPDDALVDNGYGSVLELVERNRLDIVSFGVSSVVDEEWEDGLITTNIGNIKIDWNGTGHEYFLRGFSGVCWRYFFKRNLLKNRRFYTLLFLEDLVFVLPLFLSNVKVAQTNTIVYFYIVRQSSLTTMIDPRRLNRGCDDLLTAILFMDQCKQGQTNAIKEKIEERQSFYKYNLITRLMLSDKGLSELKRHREAIRQLSIPRDLSNGKNRLYDFVLEHPLLLLLLRPIYRSIRKR